MCHCQVARLSFAFTLNCQWGIKILAGAGVVKFQYKEHPLGWGIFLPSSDVFWHYIPPPFKPWRCCACVQGRFLTEQMGTHMYIISTERLL